MKYLIIGNSAAGIGCIEGIRKHDRSGDITVLSGEPHQSYSRPLISYYLKGTSNLQSMMFRDEGFNERMNVALIHDTTVSIDANEKKAAGADGAVYPYDKLLVATGSSPVMPPIPGIDRVNPYTFTKLDDAIALDKIAGGRNILIVGAGLIGLKCAEALAHRAKVTVVEAADRILSSILDEQGAARIQVKMEEEGVVFYLGNSVQSFEDSAAVLDKGEKIPFDAVVIAVGVRPNTALLAEAGAAVDRGAVIDESGATSLADIYAAGDCTLSRDTTSGEMKVMALLPNAYRQGFAAGETMSGNRSLFSNAFPMNAIGFFGLHMVSAGTYAGQVYSSVSEANYRKLYYENDVLKGFILIGDVARSGIYTSLIREKTPLSTVDFDIIKDHPQLMAFTKEYRMKVLGGKV